MILKLGSKGTEVEILQEFLGIKVDGDFGPITDAAVRDWQRTHNLKIDGIVGPNTMAAMGLLTSDRELDTDDELVCMFFEKDYLSSNEYFPGPTVKEWVFLHHTLGWHNPYNQIIDWENDTRGKVGTEFIIGGPSCKGNDNSYDGIALQAFPAGGYAWHIGIGNNEMHRNSIGIELCNFGQIVDGKTYVGTTVDPNQIIELSKPFRGYTHWHRYSEKQISRLKQTLYYIADRDNIDIRKGLPELIKTKGVDAFDYYDISYCKEHKGLWLHTNVSTYKNDLSPQPEMVEMLTSL